MCDCDVFHMCALKNFFYTMTVPSQEQGSVKQLLILKEEIKKKLVRGRKSFLEIAIRGPTPLSYLCGKFEATGNYC